MQNNWLPQCDKCGPHHPTIDTLNSGGWRAHCTPCNLWVEGNDRAECLQKFKFHLPGGIGGEVSGSTVKPRLS